MSVIEVQQDIQRCIDTIDQQRPKLDGLSKAKAQAVAEHKKAIAVCIMKMNAGKPMELEGEAIKDPAKSIMGKLAEGFCWQESMNAELATDAYKNHIVKLDCTKSQLNGFQSINRHLQER